MKRPLVWCLAPVLLLLAVRIAPLASGERTLILRDTLVTHLALRASLAKFLADGELPLVDPLRAGGQPLAGNPNVVAFYPDNLLLFVATPLWQLNAHFWLHWLLALAAATWLGRALGFGREAALGVGVAYAFSGFFVSQLDLYNGIAGAAWAPALAAAAVELGRPERQGRATLALGGVWALALLGGDPILAALALVAAAALALPGSWRSYPYRRAGAALAAGTLLAAPQIVTTWQVLAESYRGFLGFSARDLAVAAPRPSALVELLLPLFFGRPDGGSFWGTAFFGGTPPLYFSLAPGAIALALAASGLASRRAPRGRALGLASAGLLLAFSAGTPLVLALAAVPGMGKVRFVAKFALWAALGVALLAGLALEGLRESATGQRRVALALSCGALVYALLWLAATRLPAGSSAAVARWLGEGLAPERFGGERERWATIAFFSLSALLVPRLALVRRLAPVALVVPLLLAAQAGLQLHLLAGILPTDAAAHYAAPPELFSRLPPDAVLAHGAVNEIFGNDLMQTAALGGDLAAQVRRAWASGFSFAGHAAGRRYELDYSPEGLDHFSAYALGEASRRLDDASRVRLLAATGVDRLLLPRPLAEDAAAQADLVARVESLEPPLFVYALPAAIGEAEVAGSVFPAPHLNAALGRLRSPDFDPRREAVIPGGGAPRAGVPGRARIVATRPEEIEVEVDAPDGGILVLRRAYLPLWRASIDGRAAKPLPAQMTRLGLELPPGGHRVRFWTDRRPFRLASALALLGLAALVVVARRPGGSMPRPNEATEP